MKIIKLKNNLTILYFQDSAINTVYFDISIKAGSRNETKQNNGILHLIEHIIYTKSYESYKLNKKHKDYILKNFSGSTHKDRTNFSMKANKKDFIDCVEITKEILSLENITEEMLRREVLIISDEIRIEKKEPSYNYSFKVDNYIYKNTSYLLDPLGTVKNLRSFSLKKIKSTIKKHYNANSIIISIYGDVNIKNIKELKNILLPKSKSQNKIKSPLKLRPTKQTITSKDSLIGGYKILKINTSEEALLYWFISESLSDQIYNYVRVKMNNYNLSSYITLFEDFGIFSMESYSQKSKLNEVLKLTNDFILNFYEDLSEKQYKDLKNKVIDQLALELDDPQEIINTVSYHALMYGENKILTIERQITLIKKISFEDFRSALKKLIKSPEATFITK